MMHVYMHFLFINFLTVSYILTASSAGIAVFSAVFCGLTEGGFSDIFSSTVQLVC